MHIDRVLLSAVCLPLLTGSMIMRAHATEACGELDECKVLIEINASDGDIGFHWLADAEDLVETEIEDADGRKIFENKAHGALRDQKLTETFGESSEPVCREELKEDDGVVVTIEDFVERWPSGHYVFKGKRDDGDRPTGMTPLSYHIPAAPAQVTYTPGTGTITWLPGTDLGECATELELHGLVTDGVLPVHPMTVAPVGWEVVLEADDGSGLKFTSRLPAGQLSVTVPVEFLLAVPANTPAKVEVGAFGGDPAVGDDDNATFTEIGDLCLNEMGDGCEEEEED